MGVSWTREQQQVIDLRKRNILVSAAAGSGKTAVLVERIIKMITEEEQPVDIDRLLIVTFTNAAAAEMRERIGAAIEKALEEQPDNEHLQRQLTLIHNAQITTIDSFCLYVIRNHFQEIDLEPNFRIGDEGELKLLRQDVLAKVLSGHYESPTAEFTSFVEGYASGRTDAALTEMILSLYEFSRSYPWPGEWLDACVKGYETDQEKGEESVLESAVWMQPLMTNIRYVLQDMVHMLQEALELTLEIDGPYMYEKTIRSDLEQFEHLAELEKYHELREALLALNYARLASSRGFDGDAGKMERVKAIRDTVKDTVKKMNSQYFFCSPEVMVQQLHETLPMAKELVALTREFAEAFAQEKRRKNLVDFHDLEHFALEILVDKETKQPRSAAEEFQDNFEEIMIDEYQDSNHVQETILRAISREGRGENNIFMVGDVKQSIYRFRLARPELFMEKYDTYSTEESTAQRIDLHKNFRSRREVLSCTNDIFYRIMKKNLGNVEYDEDAALYPGANYKEPEEMGMFAPEVLLADSNDALLSDSDYNEYSDRKLLEAKVVANRIRGLMEEQLVTDKATGELRRARYSDIVILLRSLTGWAEAFAAVLNDEGIPAHTVSATGYFSAVEVQTVLSFLRILDNPRQDIPLAAVLRSPMAGMTDEELAQIRLVDGGKRFYDCVLQKCEEVYTRFEKDVRSVNGAEKKLYRFYVMYRKLRSLVPDTPIHELIEIVLKETGYGEYVAAMPAGERRYANLLMLVEKAIAYENTSYKGLFHFVRYIDELQKYDVDFGEADMLNENENVVRIMSIHKSKGLEFPVVFVSGLGKNFNRQDVRSHMVLHPDLGLGLDYMDGSRRIKSPTITKRAIAGQIELENLGEELRVLYVALTRAKEKLIMTGSRKDAKEYLEKWKSEATCGSVPYINRTSAAGYFDWILPALLSYGEKYEIRLVPVSELVTEEVVIQTEHALDKGILLAEIGSADQAKVEELENRFSFQYPYQTDVQRKNKYSVSELKHRAMREHFEAEQEDAVPAFTKEEVIPYVPSFARQAGQTEEEINQGALRGTAVHRVMECYQFSSTLGAREQIEQMLREEKITESMKELVKLPLVEAFVQGEIGRRMSMAEAAGKLYREKPFVMGFTEEELARFGFGEIRDFVQDTIPGENLVPGQDIVSGQYKCSEQDRRTEQGRRTGQEDLTLIQGIIDVFWLEEDGIVLLDYKTDRVDTGQQLIDRYAAQLNLYAEALERIYNSDGERTYRVKEKLLYSFRLGKVIRISSEI